MAADSVITIGFDFPLDTLESDAKKADRILTGIGNSAGEKMDSSFKSNADKVKHEADTTSKDLDDKLDKTVKTKAGLDDSEAKQKADSTSEHLKDKLGKPIKPKIGADTTEADKKIGETSRKTKEIPSRKEITFSVKDHISAVLDKIRGKSEETKKETSSLGTIIRGTFIGGLASNAVTSVWSHLTGWMGKAISMGKEYAMQQQTMLASWTTLTGSANKGQAMVDMTNKMAIAANNDVCMVDQLNQKLYAVTDSAKLTGQLTKSILTLQDAFGVDDGAVANFSIQYAQMIGNGKAQAMDLMSIQNVFPKFKQELLEYEQQQTKNHKLSMNQLNDMISAGKITSKVMNDVLIGMGKKYGSATENFSKTIPGMLRTIKSTMPALVGEISKPFAKAANPIIGTISDWITSKKTESKFSDLGKTTASGLNKVVNAFAGDSSDSKRLIDNLNGGLDSLNHWLERVFDYIADHAKDIKQVGSDLWDISTTIGKTVWDDWANIIADIAEALGLTADNSDKATTPLGEIADAIHALAKNKGAVQAIGHVIVAIAAIKTMDKVLSPIRAIAGLKIGKGTVLDFLKNGIQGKNLGGALQSPKSAGGWKGLSTAGKITLGATVAFDAAKIGKDFYDAISSSSINTKYKKYGAGIGGLVGGLIGAAFGGPTGAVIGEQLGAGIGAKAGSAAKKWMDGWNAYNKKHKPDPIKQPIEYTAYTANHANHQGTQAQKAVYKANPNTNPNYLLPFFPKNPFTIKGFNFDVGVNDERGKEGLNQTLNFFKHPIKSLNSGNWMEENSKRFKNSPMGKFWNSLEFDSFNWSPQAKKVNSDIGKWLMSTSISDTLFGKPKITGKAPSIGKMKIKQSSILPEIDVGKWWKGITDKFGKLKWPKLPKFDLKLPKLKLPKIKWPKLRFPKIKLPKLKFPKIKLPKLKFPKIKLPKINIHGWLKKAKTTVLHFKFPKLKAPKWKGWDSLRRKVSKTWNKMRDKTSKSAGKLWDDAKGGMKSLKNGIDDQLDKINKGWRTMWNSLKNWFGNLWGDIKKKTQGGINGILDIINGGIGGINTVIHFFGGKSQTISPMKHVKLATGTGAFSGVRRPITEPTLALLNDGHDSPETGNREMVWDKNTGSMSLVPGVNTLAMLKPGQEVFNATETAALLGNNIPRFAKGTGWLSDIGNWASDAWNGAVNTVKGVVNGAVKGAKGLINWFKKAMVIVKNPGQALNNLFKFSDNNLAGFFPELGKGMFNKAKDGALNWWNQLWSMVGNKLDDGGADGANGAMVSEMMKLGEGKPYVWGATGPSAYDCSGLVMAAANHLGVSLPHYSGSQYSATTPVSHPQPGDLVFFGSGGSNHVGAYMGKDTYYSAQSPSAGIGVGKISAVHEGPVSYRRIKGIKSGSSKSSSKENAKSISNKRIYDQVGSGFWKFIGKLADLFGSHMANPSGDGVKRWRPYVKRALSMLHLSEGLTDKVLRQIATESSGDPKAMGGTDGLNDGHAMGLMQVKPGTFAAYKLKGHNNIWNGFDNLLAGLNYAKAHYGSNLSFLGQGHGYRNGGKVYNHEIAHIAEDSPEYVINPSKPSFDNLMTEAIHDRAQKNPGGIAYKLDQIINTDKLKYSAANGYKIYSLGGNDHEADGGANMARKATENSLGVSGNVEVNIRLDSGKIARAVYPKTKILQAREINIAQIGGAIPVE